MRANLLAAVAATAAAFSAVTAAAIATTTTTTTTTTAATAAEATATAAATTASAAATTTAITAAFTFGAGGALFAGTGDVHREGTAFDFVTVEFIHAFLRFVATAHRDEGEAAGATGEFVEDDFHDIDGANLAEQGLEVLCRAGEGKIPDVEL